MTDLDGHPTLFESMRAKIEEALAQIRPSLQVDGGDVELLDVSSDGVVRVGLFGKCAGCPLSRMLLKQAIETRLRSIAEVTKVITVDK